MPGVKASGEFAVLAEQTPDQRLSGHDLSISSQLSAARSVVVGGKLIAWPDAGGGGGGVNAPSTPPVGFTLCQ